MILILQRKKEKLQSYKPRIAARIPAPIGMPNPKKRRSKETTFLNDAWTVFCQTVVSGFTCSIILAMMITYCKLQ